MKLSTPTLLYAASLGLLGVAVWSSCEMLPLWSQDVRQKAHMKGYEDATSMRVRGRQQGPQSSNWDYSSKQWWDALARANLTGWLPPPPPTTTDGGQLGPATVVVRPLEQLIELVSLVHDGANDGKGGSSHVVVRFKPDVNVKPPAYWVKENTALPSSRVPAAMTTREGAGSKGTQGRPSHGSVGNHAMHNSPSSGQTIVQKLWVQDEGDPRRSATLWPIEANDKGVIGTIRLVRVSADARSAIFERQLSPPKPGEPAPPPTEEVLAKTEFDLPQDLVLALLALQERAASAVATKAHAPARANAWIDTRTTTRIDDTWHIGTDDEARFRDDMDRLLETLDLDTYSGRTGTRGLIVRGIDEKLGASLGIARGEVLLEINGRKVETKAQARSLAEGDYKRGVRTFQTRWLSNGQVVDRTYQARGQAQ